MLQVYAYESSVGETLGRRLHGLTRQTLTSAVRMWTVLTARPKGISTRQLHHMGSRRDYSDGEASCLVPAVNLTDPHIAVLPESELIRETVHRPQSK